MSLISLDTNPVKPALRILLQDKTTKKNIFFATDAYEEFGYSLKDEITIDSIEKIKLLPRVEKEQAHQQARTRSKAEVFTPSWVCNKMNNHCDEEWFGRPNVFNIENGESWTINTEPIDFGEESWQDYIDSRRIEITCGEAPYIASRYDTTTGEIIPVNERIGILDRKLRVVNENTEDDNEWRKWIERAFQSVYGYEFQGDNLLIARINVLNTYADYYKERFGKDPSDNDIRKIANIIAWNFWQMDGITGTIPFGEAESDDGYQTSFFESMMQDTENITPVCRIFDWRSNESLKYTDIRRGK